MLPCSGQVRDAGAGWAAPRAEEAHPGTPRTAAQREKPYRSGRQGVPGAPCGRDSFRPGASGLAMSGGLRGQHSPWTDGGRPAQRRFVLPPLSVRRRPRSTALSSRGSSTVFSSPSGFDWEHGVVHRGTCERWNSLVRGRGPAVRGLGRWRRRLSRRTITHAVRVCTRCDGIVDSRGDNRSEGTGLLAW